MIGHRRAAVALHELHEEDRNWILAELLPQDRNTLNDYLTEIRALGFASDQSFANEATVLSYGDTEASSPLERLRRASAEDVYGVLKDESPVLIAKLLKVDEWLWKAQFLAHFGDAMQSRLREIQSSTGLVAPSLAEHLIVEVALRLPHATDANSTPSASGMLASVKQSLYGFLNRRTKSKQ